MERREHGAAGALPSRGGLVAGAVGPRPCSPPALRDHRRDPRGGRRGAARRLGRSWRWPRRASSRTSRAKALALEDDEHRGARQLVRLVEHPEAFLNPVLLLGARLPAGGGDPGRHPGRAALRRPGGVAVATVFEVVVIFVAGRGAPQELGGAEPRALGPVRRSVRLTRWCASRRSGCCRAASIGLANAAHAVRASAEAGRDRESELLAMADVAMEEEVIETEERALIHSIIEFGDTVVREVMVPASRHASRSKRTVAVSEALERGHRGGLQPPPGLRRQRRRHRRHRLRQGPDARRARRTRRTSPCATTSARPTSSPRPSGWPSSCARCRSASTTWPSWSTSTAAPPAW